MEENSEPKGLGGWLLLPMIGTVISPFIKAYVLYDATPALFAPMPSDHKAVIIFEVVVHAALGIAWIVAILRLFGRKRSYPTLFAGLLLAELAFTMIDLLIATKALGLALDTEDYRVLGRALTGALIWCPYMFKSKRVQNTFVVP